MTRKGNELQWAMGLVGLTVVAILFSAAASDRALPQHPSLQGTWKLNEDLTARMRQDDPSQGSPGFGRGGGMGGHGGGRRRGGGRPGGSPEATPGDSGRDD